MRIGFDAKRIYHNKSGLGNYSRDMVRMLTNFYPENEYLLYNPKAASIAFDAGERSRMILPAGSINTIFSSLWRRKWITDQLKKDQLDLYHGLSNELPAGISRTGISSIVSIHDLIFYKYPQWYKSADRIIHQKKVKQASLEATHIIAISEQTKNDILEYIDVPSEKISVVYQGCHPAFKLTFSPDELKSVKEKFGLPATFMLSVGTIEPRKNLLTTIKSLKHHNLPLVMVGKKTQYFNEIEKYIRDNNLGKRVFYISGINMIELAMVYQLAFVFCYPSIYEGFGIPIIEALYSNTPVITNQNGCFREAGGPDSFYIDCFDDAKIGEIVYTLQQDEGLYNNTILNGKKFVQQFNDEKIASALMGKYIQVAGKKSIIAK